MKIANTLDHRCARNRTSNISVVPRRAGRHLDREEAPEVEVRPVANSWDLMDVYHLTHDVYVERGYSEPQPDGRLIHFPHLDSVPETTIFVARENDDTVGTISLTLDGPAGLPADKDFQAECARIRRVGRVLAAVWRLVTTSSCSSERKVVMALMRAALVRVFELGVQTWVCTLDPRHERVYRQLLDMKLVARRSNIQVFSNAPAAFMRCDYETLPDWCRAIEDWSKDDRRVPLENRGVTAVGEKP